MTETEKKNKGGKKKKQSERERESEGKGKEIDQYTWRGWISQLIFKAKGRRRPQSSSLHLASLGVSD